MFNNRKKCQTRSEPRKYECVNCENYKRKALEAEKAVSTKDVHIEMLQKEVKKLENQYKKSIDDYEKLRFEYSTNVQQLSNLKEIHKKLKDDNVKLTLERDAAKSQLLASQNEKAKSKNQFKANKRNSKETKETKSEKLPDGQTSSCKNKCIIMEAMNIESNIQNQNLRLKELMSKLLDEVSKDTCPTETKDKTDNGVIKNKNGTEIIDIIKELSKQLNKLNEFVGSVKLENDTIKHQLTEKITNLSSCLNQLEENHSNINTLSDTIEAIIKEKEMYIQEIENLKSVIEEKNQQFKIREEDMSDLKVNYENTDQYHNDYSHEIVILREEKLQLQSQLDHCMQYVQELQRESVENEKTWDICKRKLVDDIKQLEKSNKDLNKALLTLTEQNNLSSELKSKYDEINLEAERLRKERLQLQAQLDEYVEQIAELQRQYLEKEKTWKNCKCEVLDDIKQLDESNKDLTGKLTTSTEQYKSTLELQSRFDDITYKLDQYMQQVMELQQQLLEKEEGWAGCNCKLLDNIQQLEQSNNVLNQALATLNEQNRSNSDSGLKGKYSDICHQVELLEKKLRQLEDELNQNMQHNEELQREFSEKEETWNICKSHLLADVEQMEQNNRILIDKLATLTEQNNKCNLDSGLKSKYRDVSHQVELLEEKLRQLEDELNQNMQHNKELQREFSEKEETWNICKSHLLGDVEQMEQNNKILIDKLATLTEQKKSNSDSELNDDNINNDTKKREQILKGQLDQYMQQVAELQLQLLEKEEGWAGCNCKLLDNIKQLEQSNNVLRQTLVTLGEQNNSNSDSKLTGKHDICCQVELQEDKLWQMEDKLDENTQHNVELQREFLEKAWNICKSNLLGHITQMEQNNKVLNAKLATLIEQNKSNIDSELKSKCNDISEQNNSNSDSKLKGKDDICCQEEKIRQLQDKLDQNLQHVVDLQREFLENEEAWNVCKSNLLDDIKEMDQYNKVVNDKLTILTEQTKSNLDSVLKTKYNDISRQVELREERPRQLEDELDQNMQHNVELQREFLEKEKAWNICKSNLLDDIKHLEQTNKILNEKLATLTVQNKPNLDSDLKSIYNDISRRIELREERLRLLQDTLDQNMQHVIDLQREFFDKEVAWNSYNTKQLDDIKQLEQNNQSLYDIIHIVSQDNKSNLDKIADLERSLNETSKEYQQSEGILKQKYLDLAEEVEKYKCILMSLPERGYDGNSTDLKTNEELSPLNSIETNQSNSKDVNQLNYQIQLLEQQVRDLTLENSAYEKENKYYRLKGNRLFSQLRHSEGEEIVDEGNEECCTVISAENKIELQEQMADGKKSQEHLKGSKDNEAKSKIYLIEEELKQVQAVKAVIENENENLRSQINNLQTELTDIHLHFENQIIYQQQKIDALEKEQIDKSKQISGCYDQLQHVKQIADEQRRDAEKYLSTIQDLENQKAILETDQIKLNNEIQQNLEEIKYLKVRIQEGTDVAIKNESNVKNIKSINDKINKKMETINTDYCQGRLINHLQQCIEKSNQLLEECEKELKKMHNANEILRKENDTLRVNYKISLQSRR